MYVASWQSLLSLNSLVSTFVALVYGFSLLPIFPFVVKYSPSSIFVSLLTAVMNFVNAKSTFPSIILS